MSNRKQKRQKGSYTELELQEVAITSFLGTWGAQRRTSSPMEESGSQGKRARWHHSRPFLIRKHGIWGKAGLKTNCCLQGDPAPAPDSTHTGSRISSFMSMEPLGSTWHLALAWPCPEWWVFGKWILSLSLSVFPPQALTQPSFCLSNQELILKIWIIESTSNFQPLLMLLIKTILS